MWERHKLRIIFTPLRKVEFQQLAVLSYIRFNMQYNSGIYKIEIQTILIPWQ